MKADLMTAPSSADPCADNVPIDTPTTPLPLPLTSFEQFLWRSDSADVPMVFRVMMRLVGTPDRELLERAFHDSVARHPLLNSVIRNRSGKLVWEPAEQPPVLEWDTAEQTDRNSDCGSAVESIALTASAGLRVRVHSANRLLLVWLDFHHASCDGMGARQLITDWFHLYDRFCRNESHSLTVLESDKLKFRGSLQQRAGTEPIGLREGIRNFYVTVCGRTAKLPRRPDDSNPNRSPSTWIMERTFSVQETAAIRSVLKQYGVSINDVGIAVCMQAFANCFAAVHPGHFITVLNPVDLRLPSDRYLSAANRTGFTYLRRRRKECLDQPMSVLLAGIREQTTYIKERYVGAEFIHGLNGADRWPGVLPFLQRVGWFTPTLQYTCLGDTTRGRRYGFRIIEDSVAFGELLVDRITGFAPLAPGVPFSVTACETNSRLLMSVSANGQFVTQQQSVDFTDALIAGILQWAGLPLRDPVEQEVR